MEGQPGDVDGQGLVEPQIRSGPEPQHQRRHHDGHRAGRRWPPSGGGRTAVPRGRRERAPRGSARRSPPDREPTSARAAVPRSDGGTRSSGSTTGAEPVEGASMDRMVPSVRPGVGSAAHRWAWGLRGVACPHGTMPCGSMMPLEQGDRSSGRRTAVQSGERWGSSVASGNELSRRSFLSRGAATGGLVMLGAGGASVLAGCSSSPSTSSTTGSPSSGSKPGINTGHSQKGGSATIGTVAEIDGFFPRLQPLGHQRLPLRQHRLRPADGGGRRRHGPALPGQVPDQQRRLRPSGP